MTSRYSSGAKSQLCIGLLRTTLRSSNGNHDDDDSNDDALFCLLYGCSTRVLRISPLIASLIPDSISHLFADITSAAFLGSRSFFPFDRS